MPSTRETHTLLIVDDEKRLRKGLARSLSQEDRRTLTAASGEEALGLLKGRRVDLVITDLVMPGMDGMTLVRKIRSIAPNIKVVITTAYGSAKSMQEAEELGVACYLAKPFDLPHLKSKLNELLTGDVSMAKQGASASTPLRGVASKTARRRAGGGRLSTGGRWALCSVCFAGGKRLSGAASLSRKALPYIRPKNVMLAVMLAAGKVAKAVAAATSELARRGGLASVFTRLPARFLQGRRRWQTLGQLRCPDDAAKKEAKGK